jgi:hypothetical protein
MVLFPQRGCILLAIRNEHVVPGSLTLKCWWKIRFQSLKTVWFHGVVGGDGHLYCNDHFIGANNGIEGGKGS